MEKLHKILFAVVLAFTSMLSPACKHSTDDGIELYRRYAIKHLVSKPSASLKTESTHD